MFSSVVGAHSGHAMSTDVSPNVCAYRALVALPESANLTTLQQICKVGMRTCASQWRYRRNNSKHRCSHGPAPATATRIHNLLGISSHRM